MANNKYKSKYPKIIIDRRSNSAIDSMKKQLYVEEYYDLMHHTHKLSDLISDDGSSEDTKYTEMQNEIDALKTTVNELTSTVEQLMKKIEELKTTSSDMPTISDWDVTTPGIQDVDGNTISTTSTRGRSLGTLMGFDMIEIE